MACLLLPALSPPLRLKSDPVTSNESTGSGGIKKETVNKRPNRAMGDLIVGKTQGSEVRG